MLSPDPSVSSANTINVLTELEHLITLIIDNPHIPLSGRVLVNEDDLIEQIERIQAGMPDALYEAEKVLEQQQAILANAQQQANAILDQARRQAAQITNELAIRERAEQEAQIIRQQVTQECDRLKNQTMSEVERLKAQVRQEVTALRQQAQRECDEIQRGADQYADQVLRSLEGSLMDCTQQLTGMLQVVRNGREQLQIEAARPPERIPPAKQPPNAGTSPSSPRPNERKS